MGRSEYIKQIYFQFRSKYLSMRLSPRLRILSYSDIKIGLLSRKTKKFNDVGTRFLTLSEPMDISDGKVLFVPNVECTWTLFYVELF
jgi:hypothetical protein